MHQSVLMISTMILSLFIASVLVSKLVRNDGIYESFSRRSAIDGARGLLAISVMSHHYYITYVWKKTGEWVAPTNKALENLGAVPVSMFFMITGYLFLSKIKKGNVSWVDVYKGRLRRVFPLYITIGLMCLALTIASSTNLDARQVLNAVLNWFLFKGSNIGNINTGGLIAYVNWTLAYEWVFYLLLPIISILFKSKPSWITLAITAPLAIALAIPTLAKLYLLFILSLLSIKKIKLIERALKDFNIITNSVAIMILIITICYTNAYSILQMILVLILFTMIRNGVDFFGALNYRGMKKLGDISYSIYLTHGFVIYLIFTQLNSYDFANGFPHYVMLYPLTLFFVILSSLTTYKFIELPFFNRNHKIKIKFQDTDLT